MEEGGALGHGDTLAYLVLGFLRNRPRSGYDIKKLFERSAGYFWNAGESQIYAVLKRLERAGLIETTLEVQQDRPNRRVARLTPKGERALDAWLSSPAPQRYTKDDFLAKVFFAGYAPPEARRRLLEEHRDSVLKHQAFVKAAYETFKGRPVRHPEILAWQLLTVEFTLARLQAELEVVESALRRLDEGQGELAMAPAGDTQLAGAVPAAGGRPGTDSSG